MCSSGFELEGEIEVMEDRKRTIKILLTVDDSSLKAEEEE
jgi:hypothetical protein